MSSGTLPTEMANWLRSAGYTLIVSRKGRPWSSKATRCTSNTATGPSPGSLKKAVSLLSGVRGRDQVPITDLTKSERGA
jgi:hypothetical protein